MSRQPRQSRGAKALHQKRKATIAGVPTEMLDTLNALYSAGGDLRSVLKAVKPSERSQPIREEVERVPFLIAFHGLTSVVVNMQTDSSSGRLGRRPGGHAMSATKVVQRSASAGPVPIRRFRRLRPATAEGSNVSGDAMRETMLALETLRSALSSERLRESDTLLFHTAFQNAPPPIPVTVSPLGLQITLFVATAALNLPPELQADLDAGEPLPVLQDPDGPEGEKIRRARAALGMQTPEEIRRDIETLTIRTAEVLAAVRGNCDKAIGLLSVFGRSREDSLRRVRRCQYPKCHAPFFVGQSSAMTDKYCSNKHRQAALRLRSRVTICSAKKKVLPRLPRPKLPK